MGRRGGPPGGARRSSHRDSVHHQPVHFSLRLHATRSPGPGDSGPERRHSASYGRCSSLEVCEVSLSTSRTAYLVQQFNLFFSIYILISCHLSNLSPYIFILYSGFLYTISLYLTIIIKYNFYTYSPSTINLFSTKNATTHISRGQRASWRCARTRGKERAVAASRLT